MKTKGVRSTQGEGCKNINCPFYEDCLDYAAKRNWHAWTCKGCPNLGLGSILQKVRAIAPYYKVLSEIYPEFAARYRPAMEAFRRRV